MQLLHSFVGKSFYRLFCSQVGSGPSDQYPNLAFLNSLLEELLLSCHWKQLFQCHTNLQQDLQIWLQTASESHGQFFTLLFFHTLIKKVWLCYIRLDGQCKAASSQKWTGAKERTRSQRQAIIFPIYLLLWKENSFLFELQVIPISHALP